MLIKNIVRAFIFSLAFIGVAYSGSEDWNGTFVIQDSTGEARAVAHTPTGIQFLFFSVGKCLYLGKGVKINGMEIPEDITLCTHATVEKFIEEVQKLGVITNKTIVLGPTYQA